MKRRAAAFVYVALWSSQILLVKAFASGRRSAVEVFAAVLAAEGAKLGVAAALVAVKGGGLRSTPSEGAVVAAACYVAANVLAYGICWRMVCWRMV